LRRGELDRARRLLARGETPEAVLESLAHALTGKFLHGPTLLLQRPGDDREAVQRIVERLLPEPSSGEHGAPPVESQPAPPPGR
jgi:glutamyl-tRNA reductase